MTVRLAYWLAVVGLAWSGAPAFAQPPAAARPSPEQAAFFETTIRPLLADNCYTCHSRQVEAPFGGLRLDSRDGLIAGGDSGPAIVPGEPDASALIQRLHGRPVLMPPTGPLADSAIAALTRWVAMGAPWPSPPVSAATPDPSAPFDLSERRRTHWAWQPIAAADPPVAADADWPVTPVDRFILAALEAEDLEPAPSADRATVIRRLSFDLRGLPPTPGEIARFVDDRAPTAYADLVDRFLDSPHFGERWARHWMDLFRYTESNGMEGDPDIPFAWRYRDYLIRAFNSDVPYDQLVREHLAGDLLPNPRISPADRINESILGTANLRLVEHGYQPVDPWEDRVRWTDNQIDVASKTFLGLTVSCARCHDHKFDAISQVDYYSMFGTFYGARPTMRAIDEPAVLETNKAALATRKAEIRQLLAEPWEAAAAALPGRLMTALEPSGPGRRAAPAGSAASATDAAPSSGRVIDAWRHLATVAAADLPAAWRSLQAHWNTEVADRERFNAEHFTPLWDLSGSDYDVTVGHGVGRTAAPSKPGEFAITPTGNELLTGIYPGGAYTHLLSSKHAGVIQTPRFTIDQDYISVRVLGGDLSFAQLIVENYAFPRGGIYHLRHSPKSDSMAWAKWDVTYWEGFTAYIEFATQDDVTRFQFDPEDSRLKHRPNRRGDGRSAIGANRIVVHDADAEPRETVVPVLALLDAPAPATAAELADLIGSRLGAAVAAWRDDRMTERQAALLDEFVRAGHLPRGLGALAELQAPVAAYRALERDVPVARRAPGVIEEASPDQHLLVRGNHKQRGDPVPRGFLTAIDDRPYPEPGLVRLHMANAITAPDNPLTARVAVNRIWRHLFGFGIVRTVDNFGLLGNPPSHPALLDYLARGFAEDGYSIKGLIRRLVASRTYRLSSRPSAAAAERDPSNRLLQHANLRRLDAEAIRDSLLSISGRFDSTMYGPSVPVHYAARRGLGGNSPRNGPLDGDGRRSIYQEIRRNAHNPFLEVFDLPKPATTRGHRDATNVPAQSLAMLNSPFVIGQAAAWARRLAEGEAVSVDGRITHMFIKTLARRPTDTERARVRDYLATVSARREASDELLLYDPRVWQDVAHSLFNLKEFIFIP